MSRVCKYIFTYKYNIHEFFLLGISLIIIIIIFPSLHTPTNGPLRCALTFIKVLRFLLDVFDVSIIFALACYGHRGYRSILHIHIYIIPIFLKNKKISKFEEKYSNLINKTSGENLMQLGRLVDEILRIV